MFKSLMIGSTIFLLNITFIVSVMAHTGVNEKDISRTLDQFHQAAANAELDTYFNLFTDNAVFLGTDGSERWTKSEFKAYVEPLFKKGIGWLYTSNERNITQLNNGDIAFFDELLNNETYGYCRGTGLLVKTKQGWKISQYNLSVPVPNAISASIVQKIQQHHSKQ
ncbi:MAG: ketosteroid isomerase-like protein [Alteromonadaceae bacterium]|jgi:ketosteroid isomerase-like protein